MIKLLFLSLAGSVMALLLMLLRRNSGGKISSSFFYWAWLLVLLRFALPAEGFVPLYEKQAEPEYTIRENYAPKQELVLPEIEVSTENKVYENAAPLEAPKVDAKKSFDFEKLLRWEVLWLGVAVLVILKQSIGYLLFSRKLRSTLEPVNDFELQQYISIKQRFKPEIAKSAAVNTPMILGLKNPLLVLPKREYGWNTLNNILLHEFTHYRRGDIILKWFAMLVFAFHWFNPLCLLFKKELDTVCELSCDEKLLKNMNKQQKQSYGETLLELASAKPLKSGTPATCLAEEKHVLRERLEQIMKYKKRSKLGMIAMVLSLVILAGCTVAVGPDTTPEIAKAPTTAHVVNNENGTKVHNVDEFLAAIGPGANIILAEGTFNLSEAESYGINPESGYYGWHEWGDGYELQILNADGLKISGAGMGKSNIVTEPRSVNVLRFVGGENISLSNFTAGHTEAAGACQGGVIHLDGVRNADIDACELFGCGTVGVNAQHCMNVLVRNSVIRDCSVQAVCAYDSHYVQVENCEIYDCAETSFLFGVNDTSNFVLSNSRLHHNHSEVMFQGDNNRDMKLLGNEIYDNDRVDYMFFVTEDLLVEGCSFDGEIDNWYSDDIIPARPRAIDSQGNKLQGEDLEKMEHRRIDFSFAEGSGLQSAEIKEISVKTVDEFLAALASNTRIVLDGELFDLSTASDYGEGSNDWYYWRSCADGFELVLTELENFSIVGRGKDKSSIVTAPRYANVLRFEKCADISLFGFTAGHTEEKGLCTGGVLQFISSDRVYVEGCGLFGCGTFGIEAAGCYGLEVVNTEIYDCTSAAFNIYFSKDVNFENCDVHDMPSLGAYIKGETSVVYNGAVLGEGNYYIEDGKFVTDSPQQSFEPMPTPEQGAFSMWYGELEVPKEIIMQVGEEFRFHAGSSPLDVGEETVTWTVSHPDAVELEPYDEGKGYRCTVRLVKFVGGAVELTASRGDESTVVTIYCVDESTMPVPTPRPGEFGIWFRETRIVSDCTIRVGEEPVVFSCGVSADDASRDATSVWTVSNPDAVKLDQAGCLCAVTVVGAVEGGVELTASSGDESATITIYCLP